MPRGVRTNRTQLFRELRQALDEVDSVKAELAKAKGRVADLLNRVNMHAASSARQRRKKNSA